MELDVLKNFVKHEVEVLVAGVWITGVMTPIVKGVVTLLPAGQEKEFYGPTAVHAEVIQAVRQVRKQPTTNAMAPVVNQNPDAPVPPRSALEPVIGQHPGGKFVHRG